MVNTIGTSLVAVNVVTLVLLAISESLQPSWDEAHWVVITLQLLAICSKSRFTDSSFVSRLRLYIDGGVSPPLNATPSPIAFTEFNLKLS